MKLKKRVLVAPLNWGLGHATRCIPIINGLISNNFEPIIASDGASLLLLQKEFPNLQCLELPSYDIRYPENGQSLKWKLVKDAPKILEVIIAEKKETARIVKDYHIQGIISDNRFGVLSEKIPSVFITHQLKVLSGSTTWLSSKMHQRFIKKFDECWIPDVEIKPNLSGKLGHLKHTDLNIKYIGALSRLKKIECDLSYDLMVLLSGPEPQRTHLEKLLLKELDAFKGEVLFVKGLVEDVPTTMRKNHITIHNYMTSNALNKAINSSKIILCRSGYTSVMDLSTIGKSAFFIPTPGQFEQEYLAQKFTEEHIAPSCKQDDFCIEKLNSISDFKGFQPIKSNVELKDLFSLFQSERKFTTNT